MALGKWPAEVPVPVHAEGLKISPPCKDCGDYGRDRGPGKFRSSDSLVSEIGVGTGVWGVPSIKGPEGGLS